MLNFIKRALILAILLSLTGCFSYYYEDEKSLYEQQDIIEKSYNAADDLLAQLPPEFDKNSPFLVTNFVNIDNLEESSTFGRMISEQISSRIAQKGYFVKEIKLRRESLFIKKRQGEFILSRDLEQISNSFNAEYVIVGTYSVGINSVYVTTRIVGVRDNLVISSADFKLKTDGDVIELIKHQQQGAQNES